MTRRYIAIVTLLLIAAAVVVALHERQSVPLPVAEGELAAASGAVAIVCGADKSLRGSDPIDPCLNDYLVDFSFFFVYNTQGKAHIKLWRLNE